MIRLYSMPMCPRCEEVKRRLKTWRISYKEMPLIHLQNIFPSSIWAAAAPILSIEEKLYEYNEINTRDKLWKLVYEYQDVLPKQAKPMTMKLKILKPYKHNKQERKSGQIYIDQWNEARINITILQAINGIDITNIINTWSMKERAAAIIMWRLAQHQRAQELSMLGGMVESKAISYDPYKTDKKHTWIGDEM